MGWGIIYLAGASLILWAYQKTDPKPSMPPPVFVFFTLTWPVSVPLGFLLHRLGDKE